MPRNGSRPAAWRWASAEASRRAAKTGDFKAVTDLTRRFIAAIREARGADDRPQSLPSARSCCGWLPPGFERFLQTSPIQRDLRRRRGQRRGGRCHRLACRLRFVTVLPENSDRRCGRRRIAALRCRYVADRRAEQDGWACIIWRREPTSVRRGSSTTATTAPWRWRNPATFPGCGPFRRCSVVPHQRHHAGHQLRRRRNWRSNRCARRARRGPDRFLRSQLSQESLEMGQEPRAK